MATINIEYPIENNGFEHLSNQSNKGWRIEYE